MRIYQDYNVYEAALWRIEYLFNEFKNVVVNHSGGKDSTIIYNLALIVARKLKRLPIKVVFIDQEAEFRHAIEHMRIVMSSHEVDPHWYQMPIRISNATSHTENWLSCWKEGAEWMREKEDISIKVNDFGTQTFAMLFGKILQRMHPNEPACMLGGLRGEENPIRQMSLTDKPTYKFITYGLRSKHPVKTHYTFYPVYDWTWTDVWKAICDHDWKYCKVYDFMFQYGVPGPKMRVSNLHHEAALRSLRYLQEVEPDTWQMLTKRLDGINTVKHMKEGGLKAPKNLPEAFDTWKEYRDYLLETLVTVPAQREKFRTVFGKMDKRYATMFNLDKMYKLHVTSIIINDYHMTKISNWQSSPQVGEWRHWKEKGKAPTGLPNPYLNI